MPSRFRTPIRNLLAAAAIAAVLPLAACDRESDQQAALALPELPATLPLELGDPSPPDYAPEAAALPAVAPIGAGYIPEPDDHYAYAEEAWGYTDALEGAPPDYGFQYDDVEPWAWQGYDDSLMFVEPLDYGYRYYYYRPGYDYPYFIRDPDCGYGFRDGLLVVIYGSDGRIIPYSAYSAYPVYIDYASRYYHRGHNLYLASRQRHSVIVSDWIDRRPALIASYTDWSQERVRQRDWLSYHRRVADRQERYWSTERARRNADLVRFSAWRERDFRSPPPPRAIPAGWQRATWARDERRFAPPERGFTGDREDRQRAALRERQKFAALTRVAAEERRDRVRERAVNPAQMRAERRAERDDVQIAPVRQAVEREGAAEQRQQARTERRQARATQQQRMLRETRQIEQAERRRPEATERRQASAARAETRERARIEAAARRPRAREVAPQDTEVRAAEPRREIRAETRERRQPEPRVEARERQQPEARVEARQAERVRPERTQAEPRREERVQERRAERQERTQESRSERVARSEPAESRRTRRQQ